LHVVEFSRYERAPLTVISHRLQGRLLNLMQDGQKVNFTWTSTKHTLFHRFVVARPLSVRSASEVEP